MISYVISHSFEKIFFFFKNKGYAKSNKVGCHDAIGMYINYFKHLQRLNRQRKWMVVKKSCHMVQVMYHQHILLKNKQIRQI